MARKKRKIKCEPRACDAFFQKWEGWSLTFDDVLALPYQSDGIPSIMNLETRLTSRKKMKIPFFSAAMDTVTESETAIVLARHGGVGSIHRNNYLEQQVRQVEIVKYKRSAFIKNPKTVYVDDKIVDIQKRILAKGYEFRSFIVLDREGKVVGVLTGTDFDFCFDDQSTAGELMTADLISIPECLPPEQIKVIMQKHKKKILPVINQDGLMGIYTRKDVYETVSGKAKFYNMDEEGRLVVGFAIGVGKEGLDRLEGCAEVGGDIAVIDVAHGDSRDVYDLIYHKKFREILMAYRNLDIVAGNVATGESAVNLAVTGLIHAVKAGVGPGSICTTRVKTGVGVGQVTAVAKIKKALIKYGFDYLPIIADGGINKPGDVVKAIIAGADSVMCGSIFAGTDQSPGEIHIDSKGGRYKAYYGMGSKEARKKGYMGDRYLDSDVEQGKHIEQGIKAKVPYKGSLDDVINEYVGGLLNGMGLVGAQDIPTLKKIGNFERSSPAVQVESGPHSVTADNSEPN
jgi:IMP dehydrogenase